MSADEVIGERVHLILRRRGIQQREIADLLGITQTAISRKMLGRRTWTIDELLATAQYLNVQITDLLPSDEYEPVVAGRGRVGDVRPKGLEPLTFWIGASVWTHADDAMFRAFADASTRV